MKRTVIINIFILLLLAVLISGCGRKGQPRPLWPESESLNSLPIGGY